MNLVFALKTLADLSFFMFAMAAVTSAAPHSGLLPTSPGIVALAAYFSRLLFARFPKRPWLRFLPLLLCAVCFLFTHRAADVAVTVPMVFYLAAAIFRKSYIIGYDELLTRFYLCLKLALFPLLIMVIGSNWRGFAQVMLPYLFFYLILMVMLLRMLRHNEKVLTDRRFRLMNLLEITLICGAGYLLSSGYMLIAFRFLVGLAVRFILRPLFTGVLYILGGLLWFLSKIFSGLEFNLESVNFSGLDDLGEAIQEGNNIAEYAAEQDNLAMRIAGFVLIGIAAIIVILAIYFLFRALLRAGRRGDGNQFEDVRESLDRPEAGPRRLTRAPRDRVRFYYRKFLKLCDARGINTEDRLDSRDINRKARSFFPSAALHTLRALYLPARYSSAKITTDDVKAARSAYEEVRKSGGEARTR